MGIGMCVVAPPEVAPVVIEAARAAEVDAWLAGEVVPGQGEVQLVGEVRRA
jgi:phosphoribosylaminoimidazole (AIR) synthetase